MLREEEDLENNNNNDHHQKKEIIVFQRARRDRWGNLMLNRFVEDVFYKQSVDAATGKSTFERVYLNNNNKKEK